MLNKKYDFENNNLEEIEEPSIVRITNNQVSISHASGTDVTEIPEDGELIIQIGNIESYNPTEIESEPIPNPNPTPDNPDPVDPDPIPDTPVTPDPTPSSGDVTFRLTNNCGQEVRLSGRSYIHLTTGSTTNWSNAIQVQSNMHGPTIGSSWAYNSIIIPNGDIYEWHPDIPDTYTNGGYYFMSIDKDENNPAIYLYSRIYRTSDGETEGSTGMYRVYPLTGELKKGNTYYLTLYKVNDRATLDPDKSGHYIILAQNQTGLL